MSRWTLDRAALAATLLAPASFVALAAAPLLTGFAARDPASDRVLVRVAAVLASLQVALGLGVALSWSIALVWTQ